jgi:hypothetical protein
MTFVTLSLSKGGFPLKDRAGLGKLDRDISDKVALK